MVGDGRTVRGGFMSNVVSLQCARERAWQPRDGSNGHAFKGLGQSVWKSKTTEPDGRIASDQKLLGRLEAENAQLRENVVELALQIQALRDRTRTLTAQSAASNPCATACLGARREPHWRFGKRSKFG